MNITLYINSRPTTKGALGQLAAIKLHTTRWSFLQNMKQVRNTQITNWQIPHRYSKTSCTLYACTFCMYAHLSCLSVLLTELTITCRKLSLRALTEQRVDTEVECASPVQHVISCGYKHGREWGSEDIGQVSSHLTHCTLLSWWLSCNQNEWRLNALMHTWQMSS